MADRSWSARIDRFQQRHRWLGFPIGVVYKFFDDHGTYLAALITFYGFISLFPLLLLLASVLGFFLHDNPELQQRILDSTLRQFPLGSEVGEPQGLQGSATAVAIGIAGALYGALGVSHALQHAMNVVWAVPRHRRPNPFKVRIRGLLLMAAGAGAVLGAAVLSAVAASAASLSNEVNVGIAWLAAGAAVALNSAVFIVIFRIATARRLDWSEVGPGAVTAALILQLLQFGGRAYVDRVVIGTGAIYGVFAVVLGLLAWTYLVAVGVVLGAEINVVLSKRLYPRALLTPFTDDVDLTPADRFVYTEAARAQLAKGFESVEVRFDPPPTDPADPSAH